MTEGTYGVSGDTNMRAVLYPPSATVGTSGGVGTGKEAITLLGARIPNDGASGATEHRLTFDLVHGFDDGTGSDTETS
jgi:hypothetical protein